MITEQHTKAIEIMHYELGMDAERIANDPGWDAHGVEMDSILAITNVKGLKRAFGNTFILLNGYKRTITEWESITGISRYTIRLRLKKGWSVKDALTIPVKRQCNNVSIVKKRDRARTL